MDNNGETNGDYKYVTLIPCKNNKLKIMRKQEWKQKRKKEHINLRWPLKTYICCSNTQ
jgi:hypothetical protein